MTQSDADWLEQAARYFEKRPTGGEDMAFWANVSNAERCRSIASAFRASSGVGAKIKPLEWGKTSYGRPEVDTVVGVYRVFEHINGGWAATFKTFNLVDPHGRKNFATEAEAIAAAEADYRQRILSCLSSPLPTVEVTEEMVERIAADAEIEWSVHEDNDRAPRDFWHYRLNWRGMSTEWEQWGELGQYRHPVPAEEQKRVEAEALAGLRRSLTAALSQNKGE